MTDREKVINGLEMSYKYSNVDENNTLVPQGIVLHALALLKAQEPMCVEERLVINKLHEIEYYARINELHWMADGAALAVTVMKLLRGEITTLKAQEPRVMTLEEVTSAVRTPAYMEAKSERAYTGWALIYDVQEGMGITGKRVGMTRPGHITIWPAVELYGVKWRCWTSRPTDEQREATAWES